METESKPITVTKKLGSLIYYWSGEDNMLYRQALPMRGMTPICEVDSDSIDQAIIEDYKVISGL